ncbi:MAG: hypothetical protein R3Y15_00590 [Rikenellaceae bacterium]
MKKSFYENTLFSKWTFLLFMLFACGLAFGSNVDYARVYSVNIRDMKVDSQVIVDLGDSTTNIVKNISDSCHLMFYRHRDSLSRVEMLSYGGECSDSWSESKKMQGMQIFKVHDGFVCFAKDSQQGCYYSPTGTGDWEYIGPLGMDYCTADCVCELSRDNVAVYYHHTFKDGLPSGASYAFAALELDDTQMEPLSRKIEIKHNAISFDRLEVVRVTRRGYYSFFAFMQQDLSSIYISSVRDGKWSYPLEFIAQQPIRLMDVMVVKGKIHLLILRKNHLVLVKIALHGDRYKIKDTIELVPIVSSDYKYVRGFFVDKARAMVVAR